MRVFLLSLLVLVAIILAVVSWLLSDPNRFKDELTELIHDQTGLTVRVRGDLSWRLWPPVQLVANDVSAAWGEDTDDPLVSVAALALDADLLPLLSGDPTLVVNGVSINGLHARLKEHDGKANWTPPDFEGAAPPPVPVPAGEAAADWVVDHVRIVDSVVEYEAEGQSLRVELASFTVSDVQPNKPVPVDTEFRVVDRSGPEERAISGSISTIATLDPAGLCYQLDDLALNARPDWLEIALGVNGDLDVDVNADTLNFARGKLDIGGVDAALDVAVTELTGELTANGKFTMPVQDLGALLAAFDVEDPGPVGASAAFKASMTRAILSDLNVEIPGTKLSGGAIIDIEPRMNVSFDLTADQYTIETTEATPTAAIGAPYPAMAFAAPAAVIDPADLPILPLEDLREIDWQGSLLIQRLMMDNAVVSEYQRQHPQQRRRDHRRGYAARLFWRQRHHQPGNRRTHRDANLARAHQPQRRQQRVAHGLARPTTQLGRAVPGRW